MAEDKENLADLRRVKVKVLREHDNVHSPAGLKEEGSAYIHPLPEADIKAGLVQLVRDGGGKPRGKGATDKA